MDAIRSELSTKNFKKIIAFERNKYLHKFCKLKNVKSYTSFIQQPIKYLIF